MPQRDFHLKGSDVKVATVVWRADWIDTELMLDGESAGVVATEEELRRGEIFELADGTELLLRLGSHKDREELQLLQDGIVMRQAGDSTKLQNWIKGAGITLICIGALASIGSIPVLLTLLSDPRRFVEALTYSSYGWVSLISLLYWVVPIVCGILALTRKSVAALATALGALGLMMLITLYAMTITGGRSVFVLLIQGALLFVVYKGMQAARELRRIDEASLTGADGFDSTW